MLCLQLRKGLEMHGDDEAWARKKAEQVVYFFATELTPHFRVEEEVLFPAMSGLDNTTELLTELVSEHRALEGIARRLAVSDPKQTGAALADFAKLLEEHIRKEERQLFPLYEGQAGPEMEALVEHAVKNAIGEALQPRNLAFLS
jgi:iron-sulfur cluster repair protein YtfE (RIC family)